jgi:N-acetylglucosaminyl-diphospho-decaprenol L-rhamnosyltransferase
MSAVTAVIVSFNTCEHLAACLRSLQGLEVVVVDNGSSDGSPDVVQRDFPGATLIRNPENRGFGRAVNQTLPLLDSPFVLLLNSDATLQGGALETLRGFLEAHPKVAAVGPRIRGPEGPEVSFGPSPTLFSEWRERRLLKRGAPSEVEALTGTAREPAWISAACFLIRTEALVSVGGFDEGFFLYYEDVDLCLRLREAGWTIAFCPLAEVVHARGASGRGLDRAWTEARRSHLRLYRKHLSRFSLLLLRSFFFLKGLLLFALPPTRERGRALVRLALFES